MSAPTVHDCPACGTRMTEAPTRRPSALATLRGLIAIVLLIGSALMVLDGQYALGTWYAVVVLLMDSGR